TASGRPRAVRRWSPCGAAAALGSVGPTQGNPPWLGRARDATTRQRRAVHVGARRRADHRAHAAGPANPSQRARHHHAAAPPGAPRPRDLVLLPAERAAPRGSHLLPLPLQPGQSGSLTWVALPAPGAQGVRGTARAAAVPPETPHHTRVAVGFVEY